MTVKSLLVSKVSSQFKVISVFVQQVLVFTSTSIELKLHLSDGTNPDGVAHNQCDIDHFRASHSEKVVTRRYLDHTISWSLFLSLSFFCCSRLGESNRIYAVYQTHERSLFTNHRMYGSKYIKYDLGKAT